jgi:hypothetical protein
LNVHHASAVHIPDERLPKGKKIAFPCPRGKGIIELDLSGHDESGVAGQMSASRIF